MHDDWSARGERLSILLEVLLQLIDRHGFLSIFCGLAGEKPLKASGASRRPADAALVVLASRVAAPVFLLLYGLPKALEGALVTREG